MTPDEIKRLITPDAETGLLPCICGAKAVQISYDGAGYEPSSSSIECSDCNFRVDWTPTAKLEHSLEQTTKEWNTRASTPAIKQLLGVMKKMRDSVIDGIAMQLEHGDRLSEFDEAVNLATPFVEIAE